MVPDEPFTLAGKIVVTIISVLLTLIVSYFIKLVYDMIQSPLFDIFEPLSHPSDILRKFKAVIEIIVYLSITLISVGFVIGIWQIVLKC